MTAAEMTRSIVRIVDYDYGSRRRKRLVMKFRLDPYV